jgi:hypothetical protein
MKKMKLNKSPGSDDFTVEFYNLFWNEIKYTMIRSFKRAFLTGELLHTFLNQGKIKHI